MSGFRFIHPNIIFMKCNMKTLLSILQKARKLKPGKFSSDTFSLWMDTIPFMMGYYEGREVRRN